jgi:hypothetical protein
LRFEITRRDVLDKRAASHSTQHIEILHKHSSAGAMPGESDVQVYPIGHRLQRPAVLHTNHFGFARALSFVSSYSVTLADPTVIKFKFQAGLETHLVSIYSRDRLQKNLNRGQVNCPVLAQGRELPDGDRSAVDRPKVVAMQQHHYRPHHPRQPAQSIIDLSLGYIPITAETGPEGSFLFSLKLFVPVEHG